MSLFGAVTFTCGAVSSFICVLVSSPTWLPFVNLTWIVSLCFSPVTVPFVPVLPLVPGASARFVQLPSFILYWIVYPLAVVLNVTLAFPSFQLVAPISIAHSIFFNTTALDMVSTLFPALSTVNTCK